MSYTPYQTTTTPANEGPLNSDILVVGETPWDTEMRLGRPFCGRAGNTLNVWLMWAGLDRSELRIENLYPYKPAKSPDIGLLDFDVLADYSEQLHQRIADMPNLRLIVPLGNYATHALIYKGKVKAGFTRALGMEVSKKDADSQAGITSLRGSVYPYTDINGRKLKVLPSIHPAATLRQPKMARACVCDWRKIAVERTFPDIIHIPRVHKIYPTMKEIEQYTHFIEKNQGDIHLAVDIETNNYQLSCVGFAHNMRQSFTIPCTTKEQRQRVYPYIQRLLAVSSPKILCNGLYDAYWLHFEGIRIRNFIYDVQWMHHAFNPVSKQSLDFINSVYGTHPFWKDEAKDPKSIAKYSHKLSALYTYNGMDCCITHELFQILKQRLIDENLFDFYMKHYAELVQPIFHMMIQGVRADVPAQKSWLKTLKKEQQEVGDELERLAGVELYARKTKTIQRDPTKEEWEILLDGAVPAPGVIPKSKDINRNGRDQLLKEGKTYRIGGKDAGKMIVKKTYRGKAISGAKLSNFLYKTLGLPTQRARRKGKDEATVTVGEVALRTLAMRYEDKAGHIVSLVLRHRSLGKKIDVLKGLYDKDSYIRTSYSPVTEGGRFKSRKNPKGTGGNLQNIEH